VGIVDDSTKSRMSSACKAAVKIGLMSMDDLGRFKVNAEEINRLKVLSGLKR
jgi:hypothetical protein